MSDPNYIHEFHPNHRGICKTILSGKMCHLPENVPVHQRWKDKYATGLNLSNEGIDITSIVARMTGQESGISSSVIPETEIYSIDDVAVNFQLDDNGHIIMRLVNKRD